MSLGQSSTLLPWLLRPPASCCPSARTWLQLHRQQRVAQALQQLRWCWLVPQGQGAMTALLVLPQWGA